MKNAKFAGVQRLLSAVFAATVALTSVQIPVYATPQTQAAEQTSQLVNIAIVDSERWNMAKYRIPEITR